MVLDRREELVENALHLLRLALFCCMIYFREDRMSSQKECVVCIVCMEFSLWSMMSFNSDVSLYNLSIGKRRKALVLAFFATSVCVTCNYLLQI